MVPNYAITSEVIEGLDRWQVSVANRPGLIGWTTQRRLFAGAVMDYTVDWLNGQCDTVNAADIRIVSVIPIPPPPEPFASAAFAACAALPSNVVPFPHRRPFALHVVGDCA